MGVMTTNRPEAASFRLPGGPVDRGEVPLRAQVSKGYPGAGPLLVTCEMPVEILPEPSDWTGVAMPNAEPPEIRVVRGGQHWPSEGDQHASSSS